MFEIFNMLEPDEELPDLEELLFDPDEELPDLEEVTAFLYSLPELSFMRPFFSTIYFFPSALNTPRDGFQVISFVSFAALSVVFAVSFALESSLLGAALSLAFAEVLPAVDSSLF